MDFRSFDDTNLCLELTEHENAYLGTVIITHGICEHKGRYTYFAESLARAGYDVIRYDLRGHGLSDGKRGDVANFRIYLKDLDCIVNAYNSAGRLFLFGHSMGGFIVDAYGVTYPNKVTGIISCAAPGIMMESAKPLYYLPYRLFGFIPYKNAFTETICSVRSVRNDYVNDPSVLKSTKIRLLGTVFVSGIKYLQKNITKMEYPILFLHGSVDKIVDRQSSKWLYDNVSSLDKTIYIYEGLYHEILNENCKDEIIMNIIEWLNKH